MEATAFGAKLRLFMLREIILSLFLSTHFRAQGMDSRMTGNIGGGGTPEFAQIVREVSREDWPPILVIEREMQPVGAIATLRVGFREEFGTYILVSRSNVNDRALELAIGAFTGHRIRTRQGVLTEPMTVTFFRDGRVIHEMKSGKRHEQVMTSSAKAVAARMRNDAETQGSLTKTLLDLMVSAAIVNVPGVGVAKLVRLPNPARQQ